MRLSAPVVICRRVCEMCRRSWQAASGIWNESSPMSSRSTNRSKPSARQAMLTMLGVCREKNTCMTQCFKPEGCSVIILPPPNSSCTSLLGFYQNYGSLPCRRKLCIACSGSFQKSDRAHAAAPHFQIEPAAEEFRSGISAFGPLHRRCCGNR